MHDYQKKQTMKIFPFAKAVPTSNIDLVTCSRIVGPFNNLRKIPQDETLCSIVWNKRMTTFNQLSYVKN